MISRCRKKAMRDDLGPFDVEIEPGLKARLHPFSNRCEKRAFAGIQIWDNFERTALKQAIEMHPEQPFTFLDVGANVGLYSLYVDYYAKAIGRQTHIIAIEPSLEICARLEDNVAINDTKIRIIRAAVSDVPGTGQINKPGNNLGETKLLENIGGEDSNIVIIDTLARICRTQGINTIDALKLDVEGQDHKTLKAFFEDAPLRLHPSLLILETGHMKHSPLIALCEAHDYEVKAVAGLNTILEKRNV